MFPIYVKKHEGVLISLTRSELSPEMFIVQGAAEIPPIF